MYNIRGLELLNVVIAGPGTANVGGWNEKADIEQVRKEYEDFEPTVRGAFEAADECHQWAISEVPDLPGWVSQSGKVVLMGDAAHAMYPYAGQVCLKILQMY